MLPFPQLLQGREKPVERVSVSQRDGETGLCCLQEKGPSISNAGRKGEDGSRDQAS